MATNPCRIAVLVSGGGTNLQALIDAQSRGVQTSPRNAPHPTNKNAKQRKTLFLQQDQ